MLAELPIATREDRSRAAHHQGGDSGGPGVEGEDAHTAQARASWLLGEGRRSACGGRAGAGATCLDARVSPCRYRFTRVLMADAPPSRVHALLVDLEGYPCWWPQV